MRGATREAGRSIATSIVVLALACGPPSHRLVPMPLPALEAASAAERPPEVAPDTPGELTKLWTVLGRAGIRAEMRGIETRIWTTACPSGKREDECAYCELAGADDIDPRKLDALVAALSAYPTTVLDRSGVSSIAICRYVQYVDVPRKVDGMADLGSRRLMISLASFQSEDLADLVAGHSLEEVVHHELFHMLDWEISASTYRTDSVWSALNPHGFLYGSRRASDIQPGFVNSYATTNVVEDRASVFQYLMARPMELCSLAERDPIVSEKVRLLWTRIAAAVSTNFMRTAAPCVTWIDEVGELRRRKRAEELEKKLRQHDD